MRARKCLSPLNTSADYQTKIGEGKYGAVVGVKHFADKTLDSVKLTILLSYSFPREFPASAPLH